jgi:trans-aconitate 2-methyltransferase
MLKNIFRNENQLIMNQDKWNPQQYEKYKKERSAPFHDLIGLLSKKKYDVGLDLGCGTGELTAYFASEYSLVNMVGIDNSETMLNKAAKYSSENLKFTNESIEAWNPVNKYDVIISNAAIQWCDNHKAILEKIYNALKPGAEMAVQMPYNFDYITHTLAENLTSKYVNIKSRGNPMLSLEQYAYVLYKLGFEDINCHLKVYIHELPSKEDVLEWVKGTLLTFYEKQLDSQKYDQFLTEYKNQLTIKLSDEKPFFYPFKRVFMHAKKPKGEL